ncbi:putative cytochrome P450 monooxygenase [Lasiosphaeris hirsuta]|uniref:Cytochrome P450 monooxygenase n=1 Tax=Lasiosphaeris hirsuta TaxID=260670 RepID=A0AA40AYZ4_9PEZI|nr:putative cytochrome P450 monooxygenase [Lasiosphaeris hirsuta]
MSPPDWSFLNGLGLVALLTTAYLVYTFVYNLYFHPLAKFPGPILLRGTRLGFIWKEVKGTLPLEMLDLHRRYGPVVRIAPDELAFSDAEAWKDIYGHKAEELPKARMFYRSKAQPPSIVTEDRENHAMLRRSIAPSFSDRALRDQEPIIGSYVDLLIKRLRESAVDPHRRDPITGLQANAPLDMMSWYNWCTFDIIGDLAFGEPFGCLEKGKQDPWVAAIFGTIRTSLILHATKLLGLEWILIPILKQVFKSRKLHALRTQEKLERRMAMEADRPDLIEGLLKKKDEWNISMERLNINASTFIIAGSETTATLLSGLTYLLLKNPEALKQLTEEIRSAFSSEEEITLTSVSKLEYTMACINEGLRCYPPVPIGMPRIVPKGRGGVKIAGKFVPDNTTVSVWNWATYHLESNWTDPFSYRPERFLHDPRYAGDKLDSLQPFSLGPRNCVGRGLAIAEMRLILAKIIFNFDMEYVDTDKDWLDQKIFLLWDKPALNVYLTPVVRE